MAEDNINFDQLERQLKQAVEADRRYWVENDAKFRAVEQRVESYDEFRAIVQAAHLRPLDKKDLIPEKTAHPWNAVAVCNNVSAHPSSILACATKPKTADELCKEFARSPDKLQLLVGCPKAELSHMLEHFDNTDILVEMIQLLIDSKVSSHEALAADLLFHFAKAPRFAIGMDFLDSNQKRIIQQAIDSASTELRQTLCDAYLGFL